jgi:predicted small metal-binding protein
VGWPGKLILNPASLSITCCHEVWAKEADEVVRIKICVLRIKHERRFMRELL